MLALPGSGDLAAYRAACPKQPKRTSERWVCLLIAGEVNDYKPLVAQLQAEAKQHVGDHQFVSMLGAAYYRAGNYDLAVQHLTKATELSETAPLVWCLLAMAYHHQGNPAEGRPWLEKVSR